MSGPGSSESPSIEIVRCLWSVFGQVCRFGPSVRCSLVSFCLVFSECNQVDSCMSSWSHGRWSLMHRGILHIYMILQRNPLHPDLLLGVSPLEVYDTTKQIRLRLSIPIIFNQRNICCASRFHHFLWRCLPYVGSSPRWKLSTLARLRSLRTFKASPEGDHAGGRIEMIF